jgi:polysaccharide biosynthesis/export protein
MLLNRYLRSLRIFRLSLLMIASTLSVSLLLRPSIAWAQIDSPRPLTFSNARAQEPSTRAQAPLAKERTTASSPDPSYLIGPGDLIEIRVFNHPELRHEERIGDLGRISPPLIGEFIATCLNEGQLAQVIAEKYRKYLHTPQISVFIKEYNSQPVAVIGAVTTPGRFQLQRRLRLLELLSLAGGPGPKAGSTLHVIRNGERNHCARSEEKSEVVDPPPLISLKLRDLLDGVREANPFVEPGDIISLPEADQIIVLGSVANPGQIPLTDKITLTRAISQAGGLAPDASRTRLRLIRHESGTGRRREILLNLEDIKKNRAEDIVLQANDVIEVPNSTGRTIGRGLLTSLASAAGMLPLYHVRR